MEIDESILYTKCKGPRIADTDKKKKVEIIILPNGKLIIRLQQQVSQYGISTNFCLIFVNRAIEQSLETHPHMYSALIYNTTTARQRGKDFLYPVVWVKWTFTWKNNEPWPLPHTSQKTKFQNGCRHKHERQNIETSRGCNTGEYLYALADKK